jgi:hypothetical protein
MGQLEESIEHMDPGSLLPMAGGGDEVEQGVDAVVPETRVTLDTRFLGQNIVVLPLEVANDLLEAEKRDIGLAIDCPTILPLGKRVPRLVVDLVAKTGSVHNGQRDAGALLIEL